MKKFLITILCTSTVALVYAENSSHSTTSRDNNVGMSKQNMNVANASEKNSNMSSDKNEPAPSKNKVKQLIIPNLVGTSK